MQNKYAYIYIYIYMQNTTAQWRRRVTQFLEKIYLSLYLKGLCVRGSWRQNRTATYWTPLLWPSVLCLSRSPRLLNRRPAGPLRWLLASQLHLVSNSSDLQLVYKLTDFLSSSSYMIVQSPTQSLEWHVWSSSSGNNCHAVPRSLSSGASVYDCTAGFYLVPYCQPSPPTRFLPIIGNRNVSFPLSLEWHVLAGSKVNIQQYFHFLSP